MPRPARRLPVPKAMIVAPQPEAVEAGTAMLAAGGNALDATLACALTQGVVDPMMCGIGGIATLQVFDPRSGTHQVINGLGTCPAAARPEMWAADFLGECSDGFGYRVKNYANELGPLAVTVPGALRVFADAHAALGRKPWASLFEAAIGFAEEGWIIRPHVHAMFTLDERPYGRLSYVEKLGYTEDGRALYLRPDGTPKRLGEQVRNPALAATLGRIARGGAAEFYGGGIAREIIRAMEAKGGLISAADLAGFRPAVSAPLKVPYRGFTLALPEPPAGGVVVGEMLRILERFDLVALGHNTPAYIRVVAEAMKIAGLDKEAHVGDPAFQDVPVARLLSGAYADECAARIRRGERASLSRATSDPPNTTHVSCVDAEGMVVSLTHTLAVPSGLIPPGTGFMLNGAMNWMDPRPGRAGSIAPGKRRYSSMTPSIVLDGDRPVATLGAPGGAWITVAVAQVLLNLLDWGMGMQEAVMAPRFSATSETIDLSNRIPRATEKALQAMGYATKRSYQSYAFAGVHGISLWEGMPEGGADPQRDGYAAGV
ncbi:gamma-glutamyltransferase family protein [Siccirubricoccus sp. KC 17139]|uniref:Gamma-glutamyltransferase family protein n=1 Tax=Siccirubricoccus soli TaxID=2899147 RepID=A0ABT1DAN5_9PROT|nr:gamma-glutamyltransferase family protein [Siccirubricoccus soli]MCO6418939.1 gamma-glutamyltransferase family protein [Siccirubricoccus soli]MCP2685074.1 gamma-glutamyltransferase family protein [Siccirubricoccus soli]